jgi:hypothetical protein
VVALTRAAIPGRAPPAGPARRFVPALATLSPSLLSPFRPERAPCFPFGASGLVPFYFARNAVFHAVRLLGLAGREVLVPAYHHGVEVAALAAGGALPRFVRVDGRMRLDLDDLERKARDRAAAIYVIHYAGFPQPMDGIGAIARARGLPVIEDCALALFSAEGSRPLGASGDVAIFCFYKALPVPNGGALLLNRAIPGAPPEPLAAPLGSTLSHAGGSLLSHAALRLGAAGEALRAGLRGLVHAARGASGVHPVSTGTSTFDPATARLGMSPLSWTVARRVDPEAIVAARRRNWFHLLGRLRDVAPPLFPELPAGVCPLFYPLGCEDKRAVQAALAARGVEAVDFWREGHPRCPREAFPEVARLRRTVLELPIHQDLGPAELDHVARVAREAVA